MANKPTFHEFIEANGPGIEGNSFQDLMAQQIANGLQSKFGYVFYEETLTNENVKNGYFKLPRNSDGYRNIQIEDYNDEIKISTNWLGDNIPGADNMILPGLSSHVYYRIKIEDEWIGKKISWDDIYIINVHDRNLILKTPYVAADCGGGQLKAVESDYHDSLEVAWFDKQTGQQTYPPPKTHYKPTSILSHCDVTPPIYEDDMFVEDNHVWYEPEFNYLQPPNHHTDCTIL